MRPVRAVAMQAPALYKDDDWEAPKRKLHVDPDFAAYRRRALTLLHARPAEPWTVDSLAQRVAASRSVLADRFVQALGVSPMRYLTQWRMQLAADLLRDDPRAGIAAIAAQAGYESEAAVSRAFKRTLGVAPGSWREGTRASASP
jgi:AraC-like DNA-binding protein